MVFRKIPQNLHQISPYNMKRFSGVLCNCMILALPWCFFVVKKEESTLYVIIFCHGKEGGYSLIHTTLFPHSVSRPQTTYYSHCSYQPPVTTVVGKNQERQNENEGAKIKLILRLFSIFMPTLHLIFCLAYFSSKSWATSETQTQVSSRVMGMCRLCIILSSSSWAFSIMYKWTSAWS